MAEIVVGLEDVANIITFVAPGYFALRMYAIIYAKREKNFSQLLIESVVFSLPIVALTNWLWTLLGAQEPPTSTRWAYAIAVLVMGILAGSLVAVLRDQWPIKQIARYVGLGQPNEDFIRAQFVRLGRKKAVALTLKNGEIVSGTPRSGSTHLGGSREYYFENIAWYNKETGQWDARTGGLIINLKEVKYIETPK